MFRQNCRRLPNESYSLRLPSPPLAARKVATADNARATPPAKNQKTTSQGTFKDFQKPLAWHHFPGDPESGVSFRALIYIPSRFTRSSPPTGEYGLPKWASWVKVIIDALKLAASEDSKNRQKLAALVRFNTNQREVVSFDSYLENRKQGQKQIFYLADMGKSIEHLSQSVFVEKLHARGYEHPELEDVARLDRTLEMVNPHQREGLRYSHPHTDTPEEKDTIAELTDKYAPLLEWLKIEAGDNVKNGATSRGAQQNDAMQDYMKKQKVLEINPRSPLIEGLLEHWKRRAVGVWKESGNMARERIRGKVEGDVGENDPDATRKRRKVEAEMKVSGADWERFPKDVDEFDLQHAQGKGEFTFDFVEGLLVKALRAGDWVLLDEINLTSPETLGCITGLLRGPTASITLTEQGSLFAVPRHPGFRLFACMKPPTDAGKDDLPPTIRARFTEIDVPPSDADRETLLSIFSQYIGTSAVGDKGAELADGSNKKPHYSMRTLARALTFAADIAGLFGLRRALWEGMLMAFTSAEAVTALAQKHILAGVRNPRSLLAREPGRSVEEFIKFGPFHLEKGPLPEDPVEEYIVPSLVELVDLARIVLTRRFPVLIEGPTSAARRVQLNTSLAEPAAALSEYLGSYVSDFATGKLVFKDGLLVHTALAPPSNLESRYIKLEIISGKNFKVPSGRIPADIYVSINPNSRRRWKSAISVLSSDESVAWEDTITLSSHASPVLSVEIRESYELGRMLGSGEVIGKLQTSWDELLDHDDESFGSIPSLIWPDYFLVYAYQTFEATQLLHLTTDIFRDRLFDPGCGFIALLVDMLEHRLTEDPAIQILGQLASHIDVQTDLIQRGFIEKLVSLMKSRKHETSSGAILAMLSILWHPFFSIHYDLKQLRKVSL
ncbi:uncharacterized protein F5891DRAFT_1211120 [Suillus fuscotomentosus]|uniref:Midasin AAA lid domain-containing protein n=1 Tax=Suillus fuscotomentosus TaxID=1912939 RepID=A0AAD4DTH0_9AGAM|nr:uncharacterized protein F5891DRAFT_1211120 [Suillus fuscotomentosus]KAG1891663.1 hypothetical protein F5891DRAFT_1211120 [Suillus fuscotomentosus]